MAEGIGRTSQTVSPRWAATPSELDWQSPEKSPVDQCGDAVCNSIPWEVEAVGSGPSWTLSWGLISNGKEKRKVRTAGEKKTE